MKEFDLEYEDKMNLIDYLSKSDEYPDTDLIMNINLEYEFNVKNKNLYLVNETDLQLLINSVYTMSSEIQELREKKKK